MCQDILGVPSPHLLGTLPVVLLSTHWWLYCTGLLEASATSWLRTWWFVSAAPAGGISVPDSAVKEAMDLKRIDFALGFVNCGLIAFPMLMIVLVSSAASLCNDSKVLAVIPLVLPTYLAFMVVSSLRNRLTVVSVRWLYCMLMTLLTIWALSVPTDTWPFVQRTWPIWMRVAASLPILDCRLSLPWNVVFSVAKCFAYFRTGGFNLTSEFACIAFDEACGFFGSCSLMSLMERFIHGHVRASVESCAKDRTHDARKLALSLICDAQVQVGADFTILEHSPSLTGMLTDLPDPHSGAIGFGGLSLVDYIAEADRSRFYDAFLSQEPAAGTRVHLRKSCGGLVLVSMFRARVLHAAGENPGYWIGICVPSSALVPETVTYTQSQYDANASTALDPQICLRDPCDEQEETCSSSSSSSEQSSHASSAQVGICADGISSAQVRSLTMAIDVWSDKLHIKEMTFHFFPQERLADLDSPTLPCLGDFLDVGTVHRTTTWIQDATNALVSGGTDETMCHGEFQLFCGRDPFIVAANAVMEWPELGNQSDEEYNADRSSAAGSQEDVQGSSLWMSLRLQGVSQARWPPWAKVSRRSRHKAQSNLPSIGEA